MEKSASSSASDAAVNDFHLATLIAALLLSLAIVFGIVISATDGAYYFDAALMRNWLLILGACVFLFGFLRRLILHIRKKNKSDECSILAGVSWRFPLLILMTFIPHLLIQLAVWPGYFTYDANWQFSMLESGGMPFTTHHPVLHTLILNGVIRLGEAVFGSWNAGIAFFLVSQSLFLSVVFASVVKYEARVGTPRIMQWFTIAYYAFSPVVSLFSSCSTKDVLFSAVSILLVLSVVDMLAVDGGKTSNKRVLSTGLLVFLTCALRNNALPALVLVLLGLVLARGKKALSLVFCFLIGFGLHAFWSGPVVSAVGATSGPSREAFALPGQMLARAYHVDDTLSSSDRKAIEEAIPSVRDYCPTNADPIKNTMRGNLDDLKLWGRIGLQSPKAYIDAALRNTQAAWDLGTSRLTGYVDSNTYKEAETCLFARGTEEPGIRDSKIPALEEALILIAQHGVLEDIPIVGLLVRVSFMNWVAVIGLWFGFIEHDYRLFGVSLVVVAVGVSSLFAPLVLARYYLLSFMAFPLIIGLLFTGSRESEESASEVADA